MNLDPGLELRQALGLNGVLPLLADRCGGKLVLVLERRNAFKLQQEQTLFKDLRRQDIERNNDEAKMK